MKILVLTNLYADGVSGENTVFSMESDFFISFPKFISLVLVFNKSFSPTKFVLNYYVFLKAIISFKPSIIYLHNPIPIPTGWFLLFTKIRVVSLHHNSRFYCPVGIPIRNNSLCTSCSKNSLSFFNKECFSFNSLIYFFFYTLPFRISMNKDNLFNITLNDFMTDRMKDLSFVFNFVKIPNIVHFRKTENNFFVKESKFLIFWAGRGSWQKGFDTLFDLDFPSNVDVEIVIAGSVPKSRISDLKIKLHNIKISFLGVISHDATLSVLNQSDLLLFTSKLYEGYPTIISEALQLGVPCLSTLVTGIESFPSELIFIYKCKDEMNRHLRNLIIGDRPSREYISGKMYLHNQLVYKSKVNYFFDCENS